MSTLLLGMGNPILSDDAVGLRLAADFGRRLEGFPDLAIEPDCGVGGLDLLEVLAGHACVVVLDSIQTAGGVPGQWYRFDAHALRDTLHLTNVHDANFATTLELGRRLGIPLADSSAIHIFAVEVQDTGTFSGRMTPVLEERFPVFSNEVFAEVRKLLSAQV
jgi:hydrogenase maturation protease